MMNNAILVIQSLTKSLHYTPFQNPGGVKESLADEGQTCGQTEKLMSSKGEQFRIICYPNFLE